MLEALSQTQIQIPSVPEGAVRVIPVKKGKGKSALGAFSRLLDGLRGNPKGNFPKRIAGGEGIPVEDGKKTGRNLQKIDLKEKKKISSSAEDGADLMSVFLDLVSSKADLKVSSPAGREFTAGHTAGRAAGGKDEAGKIPPDAVAVKGEKALSSRQVQEIPPEYGVESGEAALEDAVSVEEGGNDAVRLSVGEEKGRKASESGRAAEGPVQNTELSPAPEKMPHNLSVQGGNAENPFQNKMDGNRARKTESASPRKTSGRIPPDAGKPHTRDAAVTELVRDVKPQTAVPGAGGEEISVDLRNPETFDGITERDPGTGRPSGEGRFGDVLARELNQGLSTDIVRHASVILRGGDSGLIRLTLKPETLGNVKIRLEMSENKIIGHIIVESREALRAFEQEAPVLEAAFREAGFEGASLDMSLASGDGSGGGGERTDQDVLSSLRIAASYDAASGLAEDADSGGSKGLYAAGRSAINMLA
ncbi:MAG: flagellar hook-length control protein FliK [Treponema sp.]|jgi:hypothetical protein|nr:flagellar hook-length control protein FliK [Treponema sp.]